MLSVFEVKNYFLNIRFCSSSDLPTRAMAIIEPMAEIKNEIVNKASIKNNI